MTGRDLPTGRRHCSMRGSGHRAIRSAKHIVRSGSRGSEDFDAALRRDFLADYEAAAAGELASWEGLPEGNLALVLLLDQIPRNIYRGSPRAYATDAAARGRRRPGTRTRLRPAGPAGVAAVFLYAVSSQREHRRPASLAGIARRRAAGSRSRRLLASLWANVSRGHRALRPVSAPQRDPWPGIDPGGARLSRRAGQKRAAYTDQKGGAPS